ncbi:MAG TPA: hypothetical protein VGS62_06445 [Streptosporangiaceae bacterium]|nr:hypothetical protein [Streptosporangiaceae bacterium]
MAVSAIALSMASYAAGRVMSHGAYLVATGHSRHVGSGAAVGGVLAILIIALLAIMLRRWHTATNIRRREEELREADRRPPEP